MPYDNKTIRSSSLIHKLEN